MTEPAEVDVMVEGDSEDLNFFTDENITDESYTNIRDNFIFYNNKKQYLNDAIKNESIVLKNPTIFDNNKFSFDLNESKGRFVFKLQNEVYCDKTNTLEEMVRDIKADMGKGRTDTLYIPSNAKYFDFLIPYNRNTNTLQFFQFHNIMFNMLYETDYVFDEKDIVTIKNKESDLYKDGCGCKFEMIKGRKDPIISNCNSLQSFRSIIPPLILLTLYRLYIFSQKLKLTASKNFTDGMFKSHEELIKTVILELGKKNENYRDMTCQGYMVGKNANYIFDESNKTIVWIDDLNISIMDENYKTLKVPLFKFIIVYKIPLNINDIPLFSFVHLIPNDESEDNIKLKQGKNGYFTFLFDKIKYYYDLFLKDRNSVKSNGILKKIPDSDPEIDEEDKYKGNSINDAWNLSQTAKNESLLISIFESKKKPLGGKKKKTRKTRKTRNNTRNNTRKTRKTRKTIKTKNTKKNTKKTKKSLKF